METEDLTAADRELLEAAKDAVATAFVHGEHYVGAAVRSADGDIYTGVNIETNIGRAAVCAEPVALGAAATAGVDEIVATVAVRHPAPDEEGDTFVVAPCGVCREMITDFGMNVRVIYPGEDDDPTVARAADLLPSKYIQSYRDQHVG